MPLLVNGRPVNDDALYAEFSSIKSYFESAIPKHVKAHLKR